MKMRDWCTFRCGLPLIAILMVLTVAAAGAEAPVFMPDRTRSVIDGTDRQRISQQLKTELKSIDKDERDALIEIEIRCNPPINVDKYLVEPIEGERECDKTWAIYRMEFLRTGEKHREIDYQVSLFFWDRALLLLRAAELRAIESVIRTGIRAGIATVGARQDKYDKEKELDPLISRMNSFLSILQTDLAEARERP